MEVELRVDQSDLRRLTAALNAEATGRELKAELVAGLRAAATPAMKEAQASILSMHSKGYAHQSLRAAVAAGMEVEVQLAGRRTGVRVKAHRTRLRGFWHSPKRLNRSAGWDHPVFGRKPNVHQVGKPGWFDIPMRLSRPAAIKAAKLAMDNVARRIDRRTKG